MNHKWQKDSSFVPNELLKEKHICTRCGCERYKEVYFVCGKLHFYYSYTRSQINYESNPGCLDWEEKEVDVSEEIMYFY